MDEAERQDEEPPTPALEPLAFEAFYRVEYPHILALALGLCRSRPLAEDITQEAFIAAHRRWKVVSTYERPGAFVRRVALNLSVSAARRRIREASAVERLFSRPSHAEPAVGGAVGGDFWDAVASLPTRQRQVVALFYVDDASIAEIAAVLGVADGTVKAHLHAARQALARQLAISTYEEQS